jgi:hypothetical protein
VDLFGLGHADKCSTRVALSTIVTGA